MLTQDLENRLGVPNFGGTLVIICLFSFFFYILCHYWKNRDFYYYASKIPGPFALPFLGSIHLLVGSKDAYFRRSLKYMEKYQPIAKIWMGPYLVVAISDLEKIEYVLKNCLAKGPFFQIFKPMGGGIFTAPYKKWRKNRKIITQTMNHQTLNSYLDTFIHHAKELVQHLEKYKPDTEIDMFLEVSRCNFHIVCDTSMGVDSSDLNEQNRYMMCVKRGFEILTKRVCNPFYYMEVFWKHSALYKELCSLCSILFSIVKKVIEKKRTKLLETDEHKCKAFLSTLIKLSDEGGLWSTQELVEETQTMIIAGSDTSSMTESFVTLMMAVHPGVQQKMFEEVYEIFGDSDRNPTLEDLDKLDYMERVIKETLRLFPIGPILLRHAHQNVQIGQYVIPKKSIIAIPVHFVHRNPIYWPNPTIFDPDRFLPEEVAKRPRYAFMAFSIPPRNCLGGKFAMMSMKIKLSYFLRKFVIYPGRYKTMDSIKLHMNFMLEAVHGFGVVLKPRHTICNVNAVQ